MPRAGQQQNTGDEEGSCNLFCNSREQNKQYKYPTNYIRTTKYTLLTFLPKNLWLQFHKVSNCFFFLNMVIALIPGVSPVFPATTIMPLVFVLGVAALRDAYEDFQRYKSDRKANAHPVTYVSPTGKKEANTQSKDLQVGDVLFLERGAEIAVDCLIISTSIEDGAAFVETANLDGETNLKPKQAKLALHKKFNSVEQIANFSGEIECDPPNNSLHKWQGRISVPGCGEHSVDMDNMFLRGCVVRNVDWVIAVTVYTGVNTKLFLNLTSTPPKQSRLDTKLNRLILLILGVQQLLILLICILNVAFFLNNPTTDAFYMGGLLKEHGAGLWFLFTYFTYFILLAFMMPISLFVSLEFCKTFQAKVMDWDNEIMHNDGRHMNARTSSLNEELSQVQYIFTDKTGTLTDNLMRFAKAFAGGKAFDELETPGGMIAQVSKNPSGEDEKDIVNFLRLLSLCNTIVINVGSDGKTLTYDGSSTDEVALCDTASANKYKLLSRTSDSMNVECQGKVEVFDVVAVLPFTAERKMMSVILKESADCYRMYTKGADSSVLARLAGTQSTSPQVQKAQGFLDACADDGLRTLVCAQRLFSAPEYAAWREQWDKATLTVSADRQSLVHDACLAAEANMTFVGCTAIEDRLQDEVPETIHFLLRCGIVIWVLTGDKRETAVNIASTSRLLDPKKDLVIHLDVGKGVAIGVQIDDATRQAMECRASGRKCTFIIDGKSLEEVLVDPNLFDAMRRLGLQVNSAVCCRVTPLQKASVVAMFQELGNTCIGVGDGANDVSMIQEARVGIGVMGLEGSQAERASDYAIPRFKHLRRLLAVHGRYALVRNSNLIQYSFYKNLVYSMAAVYYAFYNGYSGQTIVDSWVLIFYNMSFTLLPPLVMGMFDYDVRDKFLLRHPGLYGELRSPFSVRMSRVSAFVWGMLSLLHSWIVFYGCYVFVLVPDSLGYLDGGIWASGTTLVNTLLYAILLESGLVFLSWTWLHVISIVLSFVFYWGFIFLYAAIPPSLFGGEYYMVPMMVFADPLSWLTTILLVTLIVAPGVVAITIRRRYFGINMHLARMANEMEKNSLPWKAGGNGKPKLGRPTGRPAAKTDNMEMKLLDNRAGSGAASPGSPSSPQSPAQRDNELMHAL